MLLTALFVMTMYYFLTKKYGVYFLCATLMVLTKETAVFVPVIFCLFDWRVNNFDFKKIVRSIKFLAPLVFFGIWMGLNKLFLGWFLLPTHVGWFRWKNLFSQAFHDFFMGVCIDNFMWLVLAIILAGFLHLNKIKSQLYKEKIKNYGLFVIIAIFYFWLMSLYLAAPRYLLLVYPLIFILVADFIFILFEERKAWILSFVLVILMIVSNVFSLLCTPWFNDGDRDLRLFSNIYLNKQVVEYVEKRYSDPLIVTIWPLDVFFGDPFLGYATRKHDYITIGCDFPNFSRLNDLRKDYPNRDILMINPRNICGGGGASGKDMDLMEVINWSPFDYQHLPIEIYKWK